jgi:hypothetical protein
MGPFTVKVLSKVPSALERELHPARSRLARAADVASVANAARLFDLVSGELITLVAGMIVCAIGARGWASFLSEIYEVAQLEVPDGIGTAEPRVPALSRKVDKASATGNGEC